MLHIFTFGTSEARLTYLRQTEEFHGSKVNYIKMDKWNGYVDKLTYMKKYTANIPLDDIVCFVDGYDVLINSGLDAILSKFREYDCELLLGAELNCYPEQYRAAMDAVNTNHANFYRYINSGGYIGYNRAIRDLLFWKSEEEMGAICQNGGDQTYVIEYYLARHADMNIRLDIYCRIFQNMHWVDWQCIQWKSGIVYNLVMGTTPCFIHFNGGVWQTQTRENIMPVFVAKMRESKNTDEWLNLDGYNQIITPTCFPHRQL
jgi:hypothetical protein